MKKKTPKQIAALICVVLLVSLYLITFLVACLGGADSGRLFAACLIATIAICFGVFFFMAGTPFRSCFGRRNCHLYSREATSQAAMPAWIFGDCRGVFD